VFDCLFPIYIPLNFIYLMFLLLLLTKIISYLLRYFKQLMLSFNSHCLIDVLN
jgi:hypothetical protein